MFFKFKKDASKITTTDSFEYMLFDGGYIIPKDYLEDENQIIELEHAIHTILDFKKDMEKAELFEGC